MEVILLEKVRNLGSLGDTVKVKGGYARNFLIPYGKAVAANEANKAEFETRRAELEKVAAAELAAAEKRMGELSGLTIELKCKTSEEGKLYGSISVHELFDAIVAKGVEVKKQEINMPTGPIRALGEYEADIQVHSDLTAKIKVNVVAE